MEQLSHVPAQDFSDLISNVEKKLQSDVII